MGFAELLLVLAVVGVGILHTAVPDHWLPIAVLARQRGWTRLETARAAAVAGAGHVTTTLVLGILVWIVGATAAAHYGEVVDIAASLALIGFGLWIAWGAWRELSNGHGHHHHGGSHGHDHDDHHHSADHFHGWERDSLYAPLKSASVEERHQHWHRHGQGPAHFHWHDHDGPSAHPIGADSAMTAPFHVHAHGASGRTTLLLVLGSSPMVEGIPAFFAAAKYGSALIAAMAALFALSTIATYVVLSVFSAEGLQRLNLGRFERYGEVLSGLLIAVIGLVFGLVAVL
jgi:ABC-type nickel/cobalt efflux system permease component RcnA